MADTAYFDHNATTPLDPRVRDAMLPWLGGQHGNPSSAHSIGRSARSAVETARGQVAGMLNGKPKDVIFVSSGSEANNMVIRGLAEEHGYQGHMIHGSLEHPSVVRAAAAAKAQGLEVTEIPPETDGRIDPMDVEMSLRDDTRLVCVMLANNELGTLQPVAEIAAMCKKRKIPVLCDAVQAVGKLEVDVKTLGVDYLVLCGHKYHAPLGIGALWIRPKAPIRPLIHGAPQERGLRASTENVPAIVGLGAASAIARDDIDERYNYLRKLRDKFEKGLKWIEGVGIHCQGSPRLPNTSHIALHGRSGHEAMLWLDSRGCAVSTGSACHSGKPQASRVLRQMGLDEPEALASLRISFGMTNTEDEVDHLLRQVASYMNETTG